MHLDHSLASLGEAPKLLAPYDSTPEVNNDDNSFSTNVDMVTPNTVMDPPQESDLDDHIDYTDFTDSSNGQHSEEEKQELNMQQLLQNFEENEPIFDNELLYPTPKESEIVHFKSDDVLVQGTVEALITYITSPEVLNYQFLVDFFLTFRTYIDALPLLELLLCRLSWCMKKSLSSDQEQVHIGRLVLVRTFVTIRHWLLNHFQDDFVDNSILRTLLTDTVNELANHEKYIGNDPYNLQSKIIKDLKRNYLTLAALYWNTEVKEDMDDLLNYRISSYDHLNNSRLSVLGMNQIYDPSARRSTLLYMFDNQSTSNNLLESIKNSTTGQSSPGQNPLEQYLEKQFGKSGGKNSKDQNAKDNFVLFPKASIKALNISKPTDNSPENSDGSVIEQLCSTIMKSEPVPGFISLGKAGSEKSMLNDGFTIRGNITVSQNSTVNHIESLVKELPKQQTKTIPKESISTPKVEMKTITKPRDLSQNAHKARMKPRKKKGFLKALFHYGQDKEHTAPLPLSKTAIKSNQARVTSYPPGNVRATSETRTPPRNNKTVQDMIQSLEDGLIVNDNNMDYLEEIVIRDYQNLIHHKNFKNRYSKQIKNSSRKSVLSMAFDMGDRDSKFDPSESPTKWKKSWYDEGQLERSMNAMNQAVAPDQQDKSFQTPPQTIDWSGSVNDEHTDSFDGGDFVDMNILNGETCELPESINIPNTQGLSGANHTTSLAEKSAEITNESMRHRNTLKNGRSLSVQHRNNRMTFHNLPELSKTVSSKTSKGKHKSDSNVFLNSGTQKRELLKIDGSFANIFHNNSSSSNFDSDRYNDTFSMNHTTNRFSVNLIGRSSVLSARSYVTYDSEFSIGSRDRNQAHDDDHENLLRKKNALSNLRINKLSQSSEVNYGDDNCDDFGQDNSQLDMSCDLDAHEIVENAFQDTIKDAEDHAVLNELKELPYFIFGSSEEDKVNNIFNRESSISILPSPSPSQAGYNGLSQTDINELAAIPDEKLEDDPLNYTLSKLRGERKQPKVILGLNDTKLNEEEIHRKHAVAVVCQSPTKNQFAECNMNETLNDMDNDANGSADGLGEGRLEKQVRDLYIVNNPNDTDSDHQNKTNTRSVASISKLEINLVAQAEGKRSQGKDTGSIMTRVSSGMMLRDDGERSCFDMQSLFTTPKGVKNCKPILSIQEILSNQLHIPFIFKYDSETLANQMTLIERDIILEVEWRELINLKWDQPLSPYSSWLKLMVDLSHKTGLELITLRFNLVNNWIISEILLCKDATLRVLTITRFIQLAQKCRQLQNYGTLFQIMLALNSEVMKQLKSTWIRIDPGTILKFKELKDLTSPNNNFKSYRDEISNVVPSKGFIPFLPLALSDLTMYSEMPTIVSSNQDVKAEMDSIMEFDAESVINYELVNFEKFTITGETVKRTLRHIEWSRFYSFETNEEVISKCLYISSLSEEDMEVCLGEIENNLPSDS